MFRFFVAKRIDAIKCMVVLLICIPLAGFAQTPSATLFEMNEFEIAHVGFNTEASDFGPSFVDDEVWFSAYPNKQVKKAVKGNFEGIFYSIFKSPIDSRGYTLYEPRVQFKEFNTGFHEGPVSYCEATGELFVTLSNSVDIDVEVDGIILKKQKMRLRIVSFKNQNGAWVVKEEMPFNDKIYSVGQPTITPSGDTLYFTSDIPTLSNGGTDIFEVTRSNGEWGKPVALGNNINTSGNEMFPFYHPSGMLIFASNNQSVSKGGLDLYCSDLMPFGYSPAMPLTFFNSEFDDFGMIIHPSGESGYFVSNRPGQNGDDDIFMIKIRKTFMQIGGTVFDDFTGTPINGAEVTLYNCEGEKMETVKVGPNGKFLFKVVRGGCYVAGASFDGYPENRKAFGIEGEIELKLKRDRSLELVVLDFDTRKPIANAKIHIGNSVGVPVDEEGVFYKRLTYEKEIELHIAAGGYLNQTALVNTALKHDTYQEVLMMKLELNKTFVLDNIYYDLNSWIILPSAMEELNKLIAIMKENPAIKIELGSHTDSRASDQYNLGLSQRRSESAVAYIVSNGIPKERIVAKGYGETKLLNRCSNGVECSEEEHSKNRRTEFKIIGFVK
jgi:outer membrane protein OmpA-like peptidoglycan-associated protein